MKFMKLGSKSDTFYTAEAVRSVSCEVSSDLIVQVNGRQFLLHKFPLLSKCATLQKLCSEPESHECSPQRQTVKLPDFPGGAEAFELCAKFCYGITITVSAQNVVAARCAAEYLQMTESIERGNLIHKLEAFFNACILTGWRDTIITLQSTRDLPTWSEELDMTSRCTRALSEKVLTQPVKAIILPVEKCRGEGSISETDGKTNGTLGNKVWWCEDIAELSMDLFWRVMISIKSNGKFPLILVGEALKIYASKWLPSISRKGTYVSSNLYQVKSSKQILILETIISMLPVEKGSVSCSFLCKLLKAASMLNASSSSKMELVRRIGLQLEEANVRDLLFPSPPNTSDLLYDVEMVIIILEQFLLQGLSPPTSPPRMKDKFERRRSRSAEKIILEFQESRRSSSASHSSKLKVTKLVDGYLQEIAKDVNLPLSKFLAVAEAVPDFSRLDHDGLYQAIDTYLEAHPDLGKVERKRLCKVLNCKRLSMEVCMNAAQNDKLPLRVVVQVLFLEHSRVALSANQPACNSDDSGKTLLCPQAYDHSKDLPPATPSHPSDQWSKAGFKSPEQTQASIKMNLDEDGVRNDNDTVTDGIGKSCMLKHLCIIPARPKRMLSKLWPGNSRVANERS